MLSFWEEHNFNINKEISRTAHFPVKQRDIFKCGMFVAEVI